MRGVARVARREERKAARETDAHNGYPDRRRGGAGATGGFADRADRSAIDVIVRERRDLRRQHRKSIARRGTRKFMSRGSSIPKVMNSVNQNHARGMGDAARQVQPCSHGRRPAETSTSCASLRHGSSSRTHLGPDAPGSEKLHEETRSCADRNEGKLDASASTHPKMSAIQSDLERRKNERFGWTGAVAFIGAGIAAKSNRAGAAATWCRFLISAPYIPAARRPEILPSCLFGSLPVSGPPSGATNSTLILRYLPSSVRWSANTSCCTGCAGSAPHPA